MFNHLEDWLSSVLPLYVQTFGQWVDNPALNNQFIMSVHGTGGPAISVDLRRKRYRVLLLGRRDKRGDADQVLADMEAIALATYDGTEPPCGAANIQVITEPIGPGYTTENRAFFTLDLEVIY